MALIQMGAIVTKIRGKISGTVFSGVSEGNVMRNKTIPKRLSTIRRSAQNSRWQTYTQQWLNLSPTDVSNWKAYSTNFTFFNKLGDPVSARSNIVFAITNAYAAEMGPTFFTSPPTYIPPILCPWDAADFQESPQRAHVYLTWPSNDMYVRIFASPPYIGDKAVSMQSRMYFMDYFLLENSTVYLDITSKYQSKFGNLVAGQKILIGWYSVEPNSFTWGPWQYEEITVIP